MMMMMMMMMMINLVTILIEENHGRLNVGRLFCGLNVVNMTLIWQRYHGHALQCHKVGGLDMAAMPQVMSSHRTTN
jgi:hypothetical protein